MTAPLASRPWRWRGTCSSISIPISTSSTPTGRARWRLRSPARRPTPTSGRSSTRSAASWPPSTTAMATCLHSRLIDRSHALPLAWAWAEGKLVISARRSTRRLPPALRRVTSCWRSMVSRSRQAVVARPRAHLERHAAEHAPPSCRASSGLGRPGSIVRLAIRSRSGDARDGRAAPQRQARGDRRAAAGDGRRAGARHQLFRYRPGDRSRSCATRCRSSPRRRPSSSTCGAIRRWSRSLPS